MSEKPEQSKCAVIGDFDGLDREEMYVDELPSDLVISLAKHADEGEKKLIVVVNEKVGEK